MSHKLYATLFVRLTSAFWHGFYPGYFFFFGFTVLGSVAEDTCRSRIGPWFVKADAPLHRFKPVYTVLGTCLTYIQMNYYGLAFVQLSLEGTFALYNSLYWCVHVAHVIAILLVPQLVPRRKEETPKKEN